MRNVTRLAVFSLVGLTASMSVAGPMNPRYVAASAAWVLHLDLDLLKQTEVGKVVMDELNTEDAVRKLAALQAVFKFDPRKDLAGITVYGPDGKPEHGAAILRGSFDADRIVTLLRASDGYQSTSRGNTVIHSWTDANNPDPTRTYGAVAPDGAVALGRSAAAVGSAVDVLAGRAPCVTRSATLGRFDFPAGRPFLCVAADAAVVPTNGPAAAMSLGQRTRAIEARLEESGGTLRARVTVEKETPELAVQLEQTMRGIIAIGMLQGRQQSPEAAKLADAIRIDTRGSAVDFVLSMPAADAVAFVRGQIEAGKAARARAFP